MPWVGSWLLCARRLVRASFWFVIALRELIFVSTTWISISHTHERFLRDSRDRVGHTRFFDEWNDCMYRLAPQVILIVLTILVFTC